MYKIRSLILLLFAAAVFALYGCEQSNSPSLDEDEIYFFSSFESLSDTVGWQGLNKNMFVNDPCPEGGNYSLHIGGGCPQPAASYELPAVAEGKYKLTFWAKMGQPSQSAQVFLISGDGTGSESKVEQQVTGESWKKYTAEGNLNISANNKLRLEIWVGGIIFADVYIDMLKIEKIH